MMNEKGKAESSSFDRRTLPFDIYTEIGSPDDVP